MNIKEAKEEIRRTVLAYTTRNQAGLYRLPQVKQRPILLIGAPGIGKTAIVEQAAAECKIAFLSYTMTHHTRQSAIGLPVIKERSYKGKSFSITEYTMSEIIGDVYRVMEESGLSEGILFLDEINCVSETLMPAMLQFLQFKTFGSHALPEGWVIVAAGNPVRYNRSAREFDVVTLDRVKYMELEADLDSWKEYAASRGLHSAILSYLTLKPDHFYVFRHTEKGREFVTPRGWEDLSEILETYEETGLSVEEPLFSQYLQCDEIAGDFASYYTLCRELFKKPVLENLIKDGNLPEGSPSFAESPFDEKLCLIEYLLHSIQRQVSSHQEKCSLFLSLSYFSESLKAENPEVCDLFSVCSELLSMRASGMQKKKEFGLLPRKEEERELLLADLVRHYADTVRLGHLRRNVSSSETAAAAFQSLVNRDLNLQRENELRLEKVLDGIFTFIRKNFGDSPEAFLFFTELTEQPDTVSFLSAHMKEETIKIKDFLTLE